MFTEEIPRSGENINIGEFSMEKLTEFIYHGSLITQAEDKLWILKLSEESYVPLLLL